MKKIKVLWIEDGAFVEVSKLTGPLYTSGKYNLVIALNASDGIKAIKKNEFDVVIVDIRIPPGSDPAWKGVVARSRTDKIQTRLGLNLLYSLLKPDLVKEKITLTGIPEWVSMHPERFGVLTVEDERDIVEDLEKLGLPEESFTRKKSKMPVTALLDLIERIVQLKEKSTSAGG